MLKSKRDFAMNFEVKMNVSAFSARVSASVIALSCKIYHLVKEME
jgi:hypothetical protein